MTVETEKVLAAICSIHQYLADRGELMEGDDGSEWPMPVEKVRWTNVDRLPELHVVALGRVIKITAEDVGEHVHEYEPGDGTCIGCRAYNEDAELDEEEAPPGAIRVQAQRGRLQ